MIVGFDVNKALMIIENIYAYHIEDRFHEMIPIWRNRIDWAIQILRKSLNKNKNIIKYIQMGIDLIDEMLLIELRQILMPQK